MNLSKGRYNFSSFHYEKSLNLTAFLINSLDRTEVIGSMMNQIMYTNEKLKQYQKEVEVIKKMGKAAIVEKAVKEVSEDPRFLLSDENVATSIWYNNIKVLVVFEDISSIRYLPYDSKYYCKMEVIVSPKEMSFVREDFIDNLPEENIFYKNEVCLYRTTKENNKLIDKVIQLNNSNKDAIFIGTHNAVLIREREKHYAIQVGKDYPITYEIDKVSGKIYDYEDLYKDFYPTPVPEPIDLKSSEGEWKEMKT